MHHTTVLRVLFCCFLFFSYKLTLTFKTVYIVLCLFLLASFRTTICEFLHTHFNTPNLSARITPNFSIRLPPGTNTQFFNKLNISSISVDYFDVLFARPLHSNVKYIYLPGKTHLSHTSTHAKTYTLLSPFFLWLFRKCPTLSITEKSRQTALRVFL